MNFLVVHYHFRPGGVRRVIELALPALLQQLGHGVKKVILLSGEDIDGDWLKSVKRSIAPARLTSVVESAAGYSSEHGLSERVATARIRKCLETLSIQDSPTCIWAHNLGLGRNFPLARELARWRAAGNWPTVMHHHDWWFENRWARWKDLQSQGATDVYHLFQVIFGKSDHVCHATINRADAKLMKSNGVKTVGWLPNPTVTKSRLGQSEIRAARRWISSRLGENAPIWLLPCRLLRRKNIGEALLLTRWLRPEAWLVTTGGVSSSGEEAYGLGLKNAASRYGWKLALGVMAGNEGRKPSVSALMASSEVVLLTSITEGFGLPYLEAAAVNRPLVAREIDHVTRDLHHLGFHFPQLYSDLLMDPELFNWKTELRRQKEMFVRWRKELPGVCRRWMGQLETLIEVGPKPIPFSRLTWSGQLEVLRAPLEESWRRCLSLNPFLGPWRLQASQGQLKLTSCTAKPGRELDVASYGRRFGRLLKSAMTGQTNPRVDVGKRLQMEFFRLRLGPQQLYPLLWSETS